MKTGQVQSEGLQSQSWGGGFSSAERRSHCAQSMIRKLYRHTPVPKRACGEGSRAGGARVQAGCQALCTRAKQ